MITLQSGHGHRMGWSRVIKTINGHSYVYEQRTWRERGRVRTESRYVGRESRGAPILFHGSRATLKGAPRPSENATYGPGFYLADQQGAEFYATCDPEQVASPEIGLRPHHGTVYAFDARSLHLLVIKSCAAYLSIVGNLLGQSPDELGPEAKSDAHALWCKQGYDGLVVLGGVKPATVVFPASITKLGSTLSCYRMMP